MRGVISLVGIPNTVTGNKTFTGVITINNELVVNGASGAVVTLKLAANASQTGNLLELYNTAGTRVAYFDQSGNFTSTGAVSYSSTQVAQTTGIGFSIKRATTNVGDILQWQDQSGVSFGGVSWNGMISTSCSVSPALKITGDAYVTGIIQSGGNAGSVNLGKNAYVQGINFANNNYQGVLFGYDVYYNGTNYIVPGDGVNTESGGMQIDSSATIHFFNRFSSGGTPVTLSEAQFEAMRTAFIDANGNLGLKTLQLRGDNSTSDPGVPWIRGGGSDIVLNPHGTGSVWIGYDNAGDGLGVKGAVSLNYGTSGDTLPGSNVNVYVNTANSGATGGRIVFNSNGPAGTDGAYLQYVAASAGNTASRLHITGTSAAALAELDIASTLLKLGDAGTNPAIWIRSDGGTTSPDGSSPWIRTSVGKDIVLNSGVGGSVYLGWDSASDVHVGGAVNATKGLVLGNTAPASGPDVHSDGSSVYIEASGGANIVFRPFSGSATNQSFFDGNGNLTIAGSISGSSGLTISGNASVTGSLTPGSLVMTNKPVNLGNTALILQNAAIFTSGASFNNATFLEVTINGTSYKIPLYT